MASELDDSQKHLNQTEVRFTIRSMLILTAVLAVVVSALGAFIRRFPPEARLRLGLYWGFLAVLMVAMFIYTGRKRYLAEANAGRVLFRLVSHSYMFPRAAGWTHIMFGISCLAFAPAVWFGYSFVVGDPTKPAWQSLSNINIVYAVMAAAAGFSFLWWRRIVVSENGLIIRNNFVPWSDCRSWYWDACNHDVAVVRTPIQSMTAMKVPTEVRAPFEALLNEKFELAKRDRFSATAGPNLKPTTFSRDVQAKQHGILAVLSLISGLSLIYLGLIVGVGTREFHDGLIAGIVIAPFMQSVFSRR